MKKLDLSALGLLLLGSLCWWAWSGSSARDSLSPAAVAGVTRELATADSSPADEAAPAPATTLLRTAAERDAREPQRGSTTTRHPYEVFLIDERGRPLPGARLLVLEEADEGALYSFRSPSRVDVLMEARGEPRSVDARGSLRIERPNDAPTLLLARTESLWGTLRLDSDGPNRVELRLGRDDTLRVQLLDSTGAPLAGERIQLLRAEGGRRPLRTAETVGERAIATFEHLQVELAEEQRMSISVDALLRERVALALERDAFPREPLSITLPPTGCVEVHVLAEDGAELDGTAEVELRIVGQDDARPLPPASRADLPLVRRRTAQGRARFSLVETGCELEVSARHSSSSLLTHVRGPGPLVAGGTRSFEVRLGSDHPVIAFRALDAEREPLAAVELRASCELATGRTSSSTTVGITTDAQGYAILDLGNPWAEGLRRTVSLTLGPPDDPGLRARLDLSYMLQPGINDLGEVLFREQYPVFVAGRVLTSGGAPVPGARLALYSRPADDRPWQGFHSDSSRSSSDGRFELRNDPAGEAFCIAAHKRGLRGPLVEFLRGDLDVVLVLEEGGTLAGDVLLDPWVDAQRLWARVEGPALALDQPGRDSRLDFLDEDASFQIDSLPPGEYEFHIGLGREQGVLIGLPGIHVQAGETTRDPRLSGLDLRGRLYLHRVRLEDPSEDAERTWGCRSRRAGGGPWESAHGPDEDGVSILSPHERIDLVAYRRGYRSVRLEDVAGELSVSFEQAALPVRLRLRSDTPLPGSAVYIKAQLAPRGLQHPENIDFDGPRFDAAGEVLVTAPGPGAMNVVWVVERHLGGSSTRIRMQLSRPITIEVQDVSGEQSFEIRLSDEDLAELLEARL